MKIGCVCSTYNREKFIGTYLEMMQDFGVECLVTLGTVPWTKYGGGESLELDRTELILNKFFPNLKVIKKIFSNHRDSINEGLKEVKNCDIIIITDCDMFITKEDWGVFVKWIEDNIKEYDVFSINFEKMFIEYYYSYMYGVTAKPGGNLPIVAIKPGINIINMTNTEWGRKVSWDIDGPKWHHMRFCQKNRIDKHAEEPKGDLHRFKSAPQEIINRLQKWEDILKHE